MMSKLSGPLALLALVGAFASCKKDEPAGPAPQAPADTGLQWVQSVADGDRTIELYTGTGMLVVGYNRIAIRIKDDGGNAVGNAAVAWEPVMTMDMGGSTHQHGCPHSAIAPAPDDPARYEGYVVFSMASSSTDAWVLDLTYDVGSGPRDVAVPVSVQASDGPFSKRFISAAGTDGATYLLALVEPSRPSFGVNDMVTALYRVEGPMELPVADGCTIRVDPRMPGMGNHSAPGSEDLVQGPDGFYHGKVGFSMTGYWKINLIVEDGAGTALCGEPVTAGHEESSVHFKVTL